VSTLEPEWKRLPIGPDHILYPSLAGLALTGILIGGDGRQVADDMPEEKTHPYFPDHFWPYPILAVTLLVTLGLLAAFAQQSLQLDGSADSRVVEVPRPDWYFLFLFQFLKLGPQFLMSLVIPNIVLIGLLFWPLIDVAVGPRIARRLGWKSWPVPGRNIITGTIWMLGFGTIGLLTIWAMWPQVCIPWFFNGPVCGG
jgi:quinol-cytochrome oxidoreductase complex cytochrome b subunit